MIPKKIHYCWFGYSPKPKILLECLSSWQKYCPDYEFVLWDETNFNVNEFGFTRDAYEARNYAFVSDFVRVFALHNHGGVYLDTDLELKENIDTFLFSECFIGLESFGLVSTAIWGSIPNHTLTTTLLKYYKSISYTRSTEPNPNTITRMLVKSYNIDPFVNKTQACDDGINYVTLHPIETFTLDLPRNYATHHFYGSWVGNTKKSVKQSIEHQYHCGKILCEDALEKKDLYRALSHQISLLDCFMLLVRTAYHKIVPGKIDATIASFLRSKQ